MNLGSTDRFPHQVQLNEDEGELQLVVADHKGKVIIDFSKPIKWIGLNPKEAVMLAQTIIQRAVKTSKKQLKLKMKKMKKPEDGSNGQHRFN